MAESLSGCAPSLPEEGFPDPHEALSLPHEAFSDPQEAVSLPEEAQSLFSRSMDLFESRKSLKSRSMDVIKRLISFFRSRLAGRNWLKASSVDPGIYSDRKKAYSVDPWIYLTPDSTLTHARNAHPVTRSPATCHRHRQSKHSRQLLAMPKTHPRAPESTQHRPTSLPAVPEPAARPADTAGLALTAPPVGSPPAAPRRILSERIFDDGLLPLLHRHRHQLLARHPLPERQSHCGHTSPVGRGSHSYASFRLSVPYRLGTIRRDYPGEFW